MDILLFKAAMGAYLISTFGYLSSLVMKKVALARISAWALLTAFIVHALAFSYRSVRIGMNPVINLTEALSFLGLALVGTYLVLQWRGKVKTLGILIAPAALLLMIGASLGYDGFSADMTILPYLKGGLVTIHVMLSIMGEALFAIAGCAGLVYLIQSEFLKQRKLTGFSRMLPSLGDLDRINHFCLLLGFPLLTLGFIAGSFWARVVWGSHWGWDPKQVWTLIVWLFYGILLHQRFAIGWNGRKAALWSIAATVVLSFMLVGVNAFHVTSHRFG